MSDVVQIFDREIAALQARLARARSLKRAAARERFEAQTMRMWRWYMADPERTKADTARHFGINRCTLASRFWKAGLYSIGPHAEVRQRKDHAARQAA